MQIDKQKISNRIDQAFQESIEVKLDFLNKHKEKLVQVVEVVVHAFKDEKKLLAFGNGGSACDAQHFVGEFVNRFMFDRPPLPAIALTADMSILTSTANDYSYEDVFARQLQALGNPGDVAFGISTSGNSENVVRALKKAKDKGLLTVGLTGNEGGKVGKLVDYHLNVGLGKTPRIQETHILMLHLIAELTDTVLFNLAPVTHRGDSHHA